MAGIYVSGVKHGFIAAIVVACATIGFTATAVANPIVLFNTSLGSFEVELFPAAAPQTVANFLSYVNSGAYTDTFIHRSINQTGFQIVQGGGFNVSNAPFFPDTTDADFTHIPTNSAIPLEYNLPNAIGTIGAARTSVPNSATSEFFFNVSDNSSNLGQSNDGGYAVFGQILGGDYSVINAMNASPTLNDFTSNGYPNTILGDIPLVNFDPATDSQINADQLIVINSVTVVPEPSTIALALLGGAAFVALGCRRACRCNR